MSPRRRSSDASRDLGPSCDVWRRADNSDRLTIEAAWLAAVNRFRRSRRKGDGSPHEEKRATWALEQLHRAYREPLVRFGTVWLEAATAHEVVQDVFVELWMAERPPAFGPRTLRRHLFRSVRHVALAQQRRVSVGRRTADRNAMQSEPFRTMPIQRRVVAALRFRCELSLDAVADALGLPLEAVTAEVRAAIQDIRRYVERSGMPPPDPQ